MELNEIYAQISAHFVEGLMIHNQLISYYNFLGFKGHAKMHEYHYLEESINHIKLNQYYLTHYNYLIGDKKIDNPEIIPKDWLYKKRSEININEIKELLNRGVDLWVRWEQKTKILLQQMYKELISLSEFASAEFISNFIKDVDDELAMAQAEKLIYENTNYDISFIADQQEEKYKTYSKKLEKIGKLND